MVADLLYKYFGVLSRSSAKKQWRVERGEGEETVESAKGSGLDSRGLVEGEETVIRGCGLVDFSVGQMCRFFGRGYRVRGSFGPEVVDPRIYIRIDFAEPRVEIRVQIAEALIHVGAKIAYSLVKTVYTLVKTVYSLVKTVYSLVKIAYSLSLA